MLDNQNASKFDLYLPGRLVASLHYNVDEDEKGVRFVYCETFDATDPDTHGRELMKRALEEAENKWVTVTVTCPIGLKYMRQNQLLATGEGT